MHAYMHNLFSLPPSYNLCWLQRRHLELELTPLVDSILYVNRSCSAPVNASKKNSLHAKYPKFTSKLLIDCTDAVEDGSPPSIETVLTQKSRHWHRHHSPQHRSCSRKINTPSLKYWRRRPPKKLDKSCNSCHAVSESVMQSVRRLKIRS